MSRPETLLYSCRFSAIFQKILFTEHIRMTDPADFSVPTKVLSTGHDFFFHLFLLLLIIAIMVFTEKVSKNDLFTFFTIVFYFLHIYF